ncbi:MAG: hypothetical protein AAF616_08525 [Bacteroidota bacterium]
MKSRPNRTNFYFFVFTLITLLFTQEINAQDQGFIYGSVLTESGSTYTGPIRWGKEEVFWSDMFNASKRSNQNLDYLSDRELDQLRTRQEENTFISKFLNIEISWDREMSFVHEFAVAFGNIKEIENVGGSRILLTLKNGETLRLGGSGYNDIGAKISILDQELGAVSISWSDLEKITFSQTPRTLPQKFGDPLVGTVFSDIGEFTGLVQWDHDERVGSDKLDGDSRDGDLSIRFDQIRSIERDGSNRSFVTLKSGRELSLSGSNDVNDGNRGIIVYVEGLGRVDIEWDEFDKVVFEDSKDSGRAFDTYKSPQKIKGTVVVDNGDRVVGNIIYDLDEAYDIEVLNGEDDDVKFFIPLGLIKEIKPRAGDRAQVLLKSGNEFMLEDSQDVSDEHQGVLVLSDRDPVYIPWDRIENLLLD